MTAFDHLAADLSALIQQYTQVHLEASEETGREDREQNERIIRELNRDEPHSLNEDFTYKCPHGFILVGQATIGITTWQRLYELVCRQLYQRNAGRFESLLESPEFISNRGHHSVTLMMPARCASRLRSMTGYSWNATCLPTASATCSAAP